MSSWAATTLPADFLEDDELVSLGQVLGVELEGHLDGAGGRLGLEGRARGHLVAVLVEERLSGALVHERAHGDVGLAGDEALVGHRVDDLGLAGLDDLVAVGGVGACHKQILAQRSGKQVTVGSDQGDVAGQ